jgi:hypothetical protein
MVMVMMMMAMTVNLASIIMSGGNILVVMMGVWFRSFCATWILILTIFVLKLSPLAPGGVTAVFACRVRARVMRRAIRVLSSCQACAGIR